MEQQDFKQEDLREIVQKHLRRIGISEELKGFEYLEEAIILAIQDESFLDNVSKRVYCKVAQKFGKTESDVTKVMKIAIDFAYKTQYRADVWKMYFGNVKKFSKSNITLQKFIADVRQKAIPKDDIEKKIEYHLNLIGISTTSKGYKYLKEVIMIYSARDSISNFKELYSEVSEKNNCPQSSVLSAMSSAIEKAFTNIDDKKKIRYYFGNSINRDVIRPTSSELIIAIKEKVIEESDMTKKVKKYLKYVGIPIASQGYVYLEKAISLEINKDAKHKGKPRDFYNQLSKECNVKPQILRNEACRAITNAYKIKNNEIILKKYFRCGKPTVIQFTQEAKRQIVKAV